MQLVTSTGLLQDMSFVGVALKMPVAWMIAGKLIPITNMFVHFMVLL